MRATGHRLRVGVVGAGIGGLAAGSLLARSGHLVKIFERAETIRPVGAGLLLQPSGMAVLDELGAGGFVRGLAGPVDRLHATTSSGRAVLRLEYADLAAGLRGFGVHRAALHTGLMRAASGAGVAVEVGVAADTVQPNGGAREMIGADGRSLGSFDLVVIADGARSSLRRFAGDVSRASRYPWGALWFVAPDPDGRFAGVLRQHVCGTRQMLGFLPSGRPTPESPPMVSMFWSVRASEWQQAVRAPGFELGSWKDEVLALSRDAEPVLDRVQSAEDLVFAPYFDVSVRQTDPSVVVIGDAAHATSPQLGQGANLALLDAACLADAIDQERTVSDAIRRFARERAGATRYYRVVSRLLTPFFQSDHAMLGKLRDLTMGPMCAVPPLRREMLTALAGVKRGWIRADQVETGNAD